MFNVTQFGGVGGNEYTAPNGRIYTLSSPEPGLVQASTPSGRAAGKLSHHGPYTSEPEKKVIGNVVVSSVHRRKGVATAMLDYARLTEPDLHHSKTLTPDGKGFAEANPRSWQPKLPLSLDNGGESEPSPWSRYVDFRKKNARSQAEWRMRGASVETPSQSEQGTLF